MKKIALIFVLAVFAPSLVLAWLAVRSLRDQQLVLERGQALLYQRVSESLAQAVNDFVSGRQREFAQQADAFLASGKKDASSFDAWLVNAWPLAEVGFAVSSDAKIFSPSPASRPAARQFLIENSRFLTNREVVTVYNTWTGKNGQVLAAALLSGSLPLNAANSSAFQGTIQLVNGIVLQTGNAPSPANSHGQDAAVNIAMLDQSQLSQLLAPAQQTAVANGGALQIAGNGQQLDMTQQSGQLINPLAQNSAANNTAQSQPIQLSQIAIEPQQSVSDTKSKTASGSEGESQATKIALLHSTQSKNRNVKPEKSASAQDNADVSKIESTEAEFREVITSSADGMLARILQNKLNVLFWHHPPGDNRVVFGAQLDLQRLVDSLKKLIVLDGSVGDDVCAVLLDDSAKPVAMSRAGFAANWKLPFVATEIGEALPHWEIAIYPLDPAKLHRSARSVQLTIALLVALLLGAIAVGGWLIVADLRRELMLARQKTDFVSNVSHELKTPLTSIRMFSDLLAEGRVSDETKRRSYLGIISTEAARLTRLINDVLDFSKLERGEKKYQLQPCDIGGVVRETVETYRPQLEQNGFHVELAPPDRPLVGKCDRDALAQVLVNLLSNAEKYSNGSKEIRVEGANKNGVEIKVLDRGPGVPRDCETKIFRQFFRVNDSLNNGVQGSGLGLALARQIALAHGGDLTYQPRSGGGSCFTLHLPASDE